MPGFIGKLEIDLSLKERLSNIRKVNKIRPSSGALCHLLGNNQKRSWREKLTYYQHGIWADPPTPSFRSCSPTTP
jgi:hypothetical protein